MYEIRGRTLSDPITCETHGASQKRQTSRVVCVGLLILSAKTVPNLSRVLSRIFCLGGKSILKKIFEPRGGEKKSF